jgi:hypothetical protein
VILGAEDEVEEEEGAIKRQKAAQEKKMSPLKLKMNAQMSNKLKEIIKEEVEEAKEEGEAEEAEAAEGKGTEEEVIKEGEEGEVDMKTEKPIERKAKN